MSANLISDDEFYSHMARRVIRLWKSHGCSYIAVEDESTGECVGLDELTKLQYPNAVNINSPEAFEMAKIHMNPYSLQPPPKSQAKP